MVLDFIDLKGRQSFHEGLIVFSSPLVIFDAYHLISDSEHLWRSCLAIIPFRAALILRLS